MHLLLPPGGSRQAHCFLGLATLAWRRLGRCWKEWPGGGVGRELGICWEGLTRGKNQADVRAPQLGGLHEGSCKDEGGLGILLPSFVLESELRSVLLPRPLTSPPHSVTALLSPVYSWVLYEFPFSEMGDEPVCLSTEGKMCIDPEEQGKRACLCRG